MQVLLPLKEFAAAKQRLAGILSAAERAQLFEAMVEDVLQVLTQHSLISRIAICSRDQAARWLASYYGVEFIDESELPAFDLNEAVNLAANKIFSSGENDLLVVHGDLPLLSSADITSFLSAHNNDEQMAFTIAPDRRGTGTNLLAWRGLPQFTTHYGENSFQHHCAEARALNIEPVICNLSGACCDIDEPDDLSMLLSQSSEKCAVKTLAFLRNSGVAARLNAMCDGANLSDSGGDRERA